MIAPKMISTSKPERIRTSHRARVLAGGFFIWRLAASPGAPRKGRRRLEHLPGKWSFSRDGHRASDARTVEAGQRVPCTGVLHFRARAGAHAARVTLRKAMVANSRGTVWKAPWF